MKTIIFNVDDFGLSQGVNQAVIELYQLGIVKSTTALVNAPYFQEAINLAMDCPQLGIGVHLALDVFASETKHPDLCNSDGVLFPETTHPHNRKLDYDVLYDEWSMQIDKFIKICGKLPTHLDSHHHAHMASDVTKQVIIDLGDRYQIPVRNMETKQYNSLICGEFYGDSATFETLCRAIENLLLEEGDFREICCHPGYVDEQLMEITSYNTHRELELAVLQSKHLHDFLESNQITTGNFQSIKSN